MPQESIGEKEKEMCRIIVSYERDVMNFWAYIKESSFPDQIKDELMKKFRIYSIGK